MCACAVHLCVCGKSFDSNIVNLTYGFFSVQFLSISRKAQLLVRGIFHQHRSPRALDPRQTTIFTTNTQQQNKQKTRRDNVGRLNRSLDIKIKQNQLQQKPFSVRGPEQDPPATDWATSTPPHRKNSQKNQLKAQRWLFKSKLSSYTALERNDALTYALDPWINSLLQWKYIYVR